MRILFVLAKPPIHLTSGDNIRNWHLMRSLRAQGHVLDAVTLASGCSPEDVRAGLGEVCDEIEVVPAHLNDILAAPRTKALALLGRTVHETIGRRPDVVAAVRAVLSRHSYDAVVLSHLWVATAQLDLAAPRAVFDTHNAEADRLRRAVRIRPWPVRPLYRWVAARTAGVERRVIQQMALTVVCTERDERLLRPWSRRCAVVPNGVDTRSVADRAAEAEVIGGSPAGVLFLASLDYSANIDALDYFITEVVPHLPGEAVSVAGSNATPAALRIIDRAPANVTYLGQVADAAATMARHAVFVVPLRTGGGSRLKVLEALAAGVPVVATPVAVEGLDLRPGVHYLPATSPGDLARAVHQAQLPSVCEHLRQAGRDLVAASYEWSVLGQRLAKLMESDLD